VAGMPACCGAMLTSVRSVYIVDGRTREETSQGWFPGNWEHCLQYW